jgi:hypothetical protein
MKNILIVSLIALSFFSLSLFADTYHCYLLQKDGSFVPKERSMPRVLAADNEGAAVRQCMDGYPKGSAFAAYGMRGMPFMKKWTYIGGNPQPRPAKTPQTLPE